MLSSYVCHLEQIKSYIAVLQRKSLSCRAKSLPCSSATQTMVSVYADSPLKSGNMHQNPSTSAMVGPLTNVLRSRHRSTSTLFPQNSLIPFLIIILILDFAKILTNRIINTIYGRYLINIFESSCDFFVL